MNLFMRYVFLPLSKLNHYPILLKHKRGKVVNFGLFAMLNALFCLGSGLFYLKAFSYHFQAKMVIGLFGVALFTYLGARLFHLFALGRKFFTNPLKYLSETGFYVQGGIAGAALGAISFSSLMDLSSLVFLDALAFGAPLGLVFGRLGCYNYGCCYGKPCEHRFSVRYHHHESKVLRLKPHYKGRGLHPTQLYTAGLNLILFSLLMLLSLFNISSLYPGILFAVFILSHGLIRLFVEKYRDDVNFNDGRNYFTKIIAYFYFSLGSFFLIGSMFWFQTVAGKFSFIQGLQLFSQEISLLACVVIISIFIFLGYGLHGQKTGTFFELKKLKTGGL